MGKVETAVARLVEPVAASLGLELVEVQYRKEAGSWYLRIIVDREPAVGLEHCQALSEALGQILDEQDPVPGTYLLEVSSPGVERPLKREQDYHRFTGERVQVSTFAPVAGRKKFTGQLQGLSDGGVVLKLEDGGEIAIPLQSVARARLAPEFGR